MYIPSSYLFSSLSTYTSDLVATKLITPMKPNISSAEVYPQLSNKRHPVDGAVAGDSLL